MLNEKEVSAALAPLTAISENAKAIQICQKRLADILDRLQSFALPDTAERISQLRRDLNHFSVSASLVGQVKAGKTSLTNALISRPGLLPSDVNPWTSVVTSIHINGQQPKGKNAVFTFYTTEEWNQMMGAGGHLGEVAKRANFDDELDEMRAQINNMQARTMQRLGANFELLLDNYHSFLGFSPAMIERYVCLGEDDGASQEGRYADMTRSADLYLENSNYLLPMMICDTPGVNDPFLFREAVTLKSLSGTDICVVVLSAHQALNTVDMGLLRILLAFQSSQIVLFVNRIDELPEPDRQIAEIDGYIRTLLAEQGMPSDIAIVFGSAAWGEVVTGGLNGDVPDRDQETLKNFLEARNQRLETGKTMSDAAPGTTAFALQKTVDLSGIFELQYILQEKAALNIGKPFLENQRAQARDIADQTALYLQEIAKSKSPLRADLDVAKLVDDLDSTVAKTDQACTILAKSLLEEVLVLVSTAFHEFVSTAKRGLEKHINNKGDIKDWAPDTAKLRRDLNAAHDAFVDMAPAKVTALFQKLSDEIEKIYGTVLDLDVQVFSVNPPTAQQPRAPLSLMRTMSIDLSSGWFASWFARRNMAATYTKKFESIAKAELDTTIEEMQDVYVSSFLKQVRGQLYEFLAEHIGTLQKLAVLGDDTERAAIRRQFGVDSEIRNRLVELETIRSELNNLFQRPKSRPVLEQVS